jgi:hypothetical protein
MSMTNIERTYIRVIVVWVLSLAGLYLLQVAFS